MVTEVTVPPLPPPPFIISRKRLLLTPMNKLQTECDSGRETVIFVAVVVVGVCVCFCVFFFWGGGGRRGSEVGTCWRVGVSVVESLVFWG